MPASLKQDEAKVQCLCLLEEIIALLHEDIEDETQEDLETLDLVEGLSRKAGGIPLAFFHHQKRNVRQQHRKARGRALLHRLFEELREHWPGGN